MAKPPSSRYVSPSSETRSIAPFSTGCYGQLGRAAEGEATINRVLEIYPDFAEKAWNEYRMFNIPDELIRRSLDGLRKAGLDVPNDPE